MGPATSDESSSAGGSVAHSRPELIRAIGRWALTAIVINSVIGSGIFGLPSALAGHVGAWSPVAVLVAGSSIFVIVLCFAEVGSRFDQAGGPYLYAREAFGPAVGFQVGWLHVWTRLLSAAAVLNVLVAYVAALLPWAATPSGRAVTMIFGMALVTAVNMRGIREAAWTVNVFTVAKLLPLVVLAVVGGFQIRSDVLDTQAVPQPDWTEAVLLLVFAYGGFESAVIAASETRNPKRDTAFALVVAMIAVTAVYCLVQLAVVGVLPNAARSTAPVAATLRELFGPAGSTLGSVAVIVSVYGWLTGFALMTPRILFSMAERNELPAFFGRVHPRFRTPNSAIFINSSVALALGLASGFTQLATFSAISRLGLFASTCVALIVLRKRCGESPGFLLPGGRVAAVAGVAFCLWLLSTRTLAQAWFLPVVLATGAVVWGLTRRMRRAAAAPGSVTSQDT